MAFTKKSNTFLKNALYRTYSSRSFVGVQCPEIYSECERLIYVNRPIVNDFSEFVGRGKFFELADGSLGFYEYRGMSLL